MQLDTDNSSAAADAIDPIAEAIRECGYPVACTIVHNEARSKGVTSDNYANRMRNSTVFEDAADWIVGCAHVDDSTMTTLTAGEKTRREIPTETLIIDLDADGHGTPSTGGGDDPFTVGGAPVNPLDAKITGYLMANPQGVSQKAVALAVGGRKQTVVARLNLLAVREKTDKLFRLKGVPAEAVPIGGGGEHGNTACSGVFPPMGTGAEQGCSRVPTLIGNTGREHGSGTRCGNTDREHTHVDQPLAVAKTTTPPPPTGGALFIPTPPDGEPAEQGAAHDSACPGGCGGTGAVDGKPCDWDNALADRQQRLRKVEPVTHTSGSKKWDDATGTWVDTLPGGGDVWMVGLSKGVHLTDGTTVTDGDPRVHWGESWNDIELENEGTVH